MLSHTPIRPTSTGQPSRVSENKCDRMLRDVALVLHLTRTVKRSMREQARWSNPDEDRSAQA